VNLDPNARSKSSRDISFTATCVGAAEIPVTIHLGGEPAVSTWLFRKPKFWLPEEQRRYGFNELETMMAQRAASIDPVRASVGALQHAVVDLAFALNDAPPEAAARAADLIGAQEIADADLLNDAAASLSD